MVAALITVRDSGYVGASGVPAGTQARQEYAAAGPRGLEERAEPRVIFLSGVHRGERRRCAAGDVDVVWLPDWPCGVVESVDDEHPASIAAVSAMMPS
ncbi:hypothetical protein [Mycobacterium sp. URHB0021]